MDTSTFERQPGWTVADATIGVRDGRAPAKDRAAEGAMTLTVDAGDLAAAATQLAVRATDSTVAALRVTAGGLEITVQAPDHPAWETAVLPADVPPSPVTGACRLRALCDVAERLGTERATVELHVSSAGRLRVEGVDLPAVGGIPPAPKRPTARGLVAHRIELPASLPEGVPIRIPGMAVHIPAAVSSRLTQRGIRLVNTFECEDGWYLSGVAQGRPMFAVVGGVTVY